MYVSTRAFQLSIIFLREFDHSLRNIWTFKKHWNKLIEPYMDSLLCRVLDKAVFQPSSMSASFSFIQYKNKHDFCSINIARNGDVLTAICQSL